MCWLQQSAELWRYPTFLLWPLMLVAAIECFAGYRAWRFLLGLNGAVLGGVVGVFLGLMVGAPLLVFVGALVGTVLGAIGFSTVVPLGSTVFAFGTASSFTILAGRLAGFHSAWYFALAGAVGVMVAVAALTVRRPVMIVLAAVAGAQQIAAAWAAYHLPGDVIPFPDTLDPSEWGRVLALALFGLMVQFATCPRTRKNPIA